METSTLSRAFRGTLFAAAAAVAMACNSPRIEMKDPESFAKSVAALQESLSEDEAKRLEEATIVVMADTVRPPVPLLKVKPEQWDQIRARLDGKTPRQIIAMADAIRARDAAAATAPDAAAPAEAN
jgi:hypothetical protein